MRLDRHLFSIIHTSGLRLKDNVTIQDVRILVQLVTQRWFACEQLKVSSLRDAFVATTSSSSSARPGPFSLRHHIGTAW
jgi:hypothetical protein